MSDSDDDFYSDSPADLFYELDKEPELEDEAASGSQQHIFNNPNTSEILVHDAVIDPSDSSESSDHNNAQNTSEILNSLLDSIINHSKTISRTVFEGKSVTRTNKDIIKSCADDIYNLANQCFEALHDHPLPPPQPQNRDKRKDDLVTNPPLDQFFIDERTTLAIQETIKSEMNKFAKINHTAPAPPPPQPALPVSTPSLAPLTNPEQPHTTKLTPYKPSIIVTVPEEARDAQDLKEKWRTCVSFRDCGYAPIRTRPLSSTKLRVEFETQQQRDETLRRIPDGTAVRAEAARSLDPTIIVKGIRRDTPPDELITVIKKQNPTLLEAAGQNSIKLCFTKNNRNENLYNAILRIPPDLWPAIIKLERINIDHQRVHFEEHSPLRQCFNCLQFGHTRTKCQKTEPVCSHCSASGHSYKECPVKRDPTTIQCLNCSTHNTRFNLNRDTLHSATSNKCPRVGAMVEVVRKRINYGI